jgi:hypothetical protein
MQVSDPRVSPGYRLLVAALALPLLWLALQAGRAGIAGIYSASAAAFQLELTKNKNPEAQQYLLAQGESRIVRARAMLPSHPDFALQAADFATARHRITLLQTPDAVPLPDTGDILRDALASAPTRADLWSRLASFLYQSEGASTQTLHALDRAFHFGPQEHGTLLVNAVITLNSSRKIGAERAQRSWAAVVEAAGIRTLAGKVKDIARTAGMERHLQQLMVEKERERQELERRAMEQLNAT